MAAEFLSPPAGGLEAHTLDGPAGVIAGERWAVLYTRTRCEKRVARTSSPRDGWLATLLALAIFTISCGESETMAPGNRSPVMVAQGDTAVALGDTLHLVASATDPDGDLVIYGLVLIITRQEFMNGYRPRASIDQATGRFRFIARSQDIPLRSFEFRTSDGQGGSDSTRFNVVVSTAVPNVIASSGWSYPKEPNQ